MKNKLLSWQEECLEQWVANRFKGIVNVVTGAGKTVLAIGAIERLSKMTGGQDLKIKIIVPKTFLIYQWQQALRDNLKLDYDDMGFFSGTHKDPASRKFMIYVINSARYSLTRHIVEDVKNSNRIFLIADECHHYGTEENSKIFDFINIISNNSQFYSLGLSATPFCKNYDNILVPSLGNEIYRFTFFHALKADIISQFAVFNICLSFDDYEASEYENLSEKLGVALFQLKKKHPALRGQNGSKYYSILENIAHTYSDPETAELAKTVLFLSFRRKEIVYLAKSRINCVIDLVRLINKTSKIIIFGERVEMAEEIYKGLDRLYPNEVGIYHSKLQKTIRINTLRQFENFEIRILVSCKTLDEGLNVSETDVGIIVSSTSSGRQRIQRLGRVLRKKQQNKTAYFYYLFIDNTSEEDEMLEELSVNSRLSRLVNVIDICYDEQNGIFSEPYYEELVATVTEYMIKNSWGEEKLSEFLKNTRKGLLTCDWWLTEKSCMDKINSSEGKAARNYYVAMLLLIKARLGKL